jgi:hypothetical protein
MKPSKAAELYWNDCQEKFTSDELTGRVMPKVTDTLHAMSTPHAYPGDDVLVSSLNLALLIGILQM